MAKEPATEPKSVKIDKTVKVESAPAFVGVPAPRAEISAPKKVENIGLVKVEDQ
jgi:hypothetical protein